MKMIKPHVELLTQQYDKLGIFEMVELAGRTSYKSEKNMSFDENGRSTTAEAFTNKLISYNHGAALEHATIYLTVSRTEKLYKGMVKMYQQNKYSRVIEFDGNAYITTNYRVIIENGWTYDLKYLNFLHFLSIFTLRYISLKTLVAIFFFFYLYFVVAFLMSLVSLCCLMVM